MGIVFARVNIHTQAFSLNVYIQLCLSWEQFRCGLSRVVAILFSVSIEVVGLEHIIRDYPTCQNFGEIDLSLTKDPLISHVDSITLYGLF